jgi:uroporphyrinogen decarboxylase
MHSLIGFENALCAFYEDPDAVHDFFAAMLEYKKTVAECVKRYIDPDVLIFDDDYGTARATFMNPDMWREFFPQYWTELVQHVHDLGMKFELHSCGYITPLVGDFVACGMDLLQPLQTNNDLAGLKRDYGDKIIFKLAIFDKQFDALGQTEEEVRRDIRGYYETLAPGGNFIPDLVPIDDPYYKIQAEVQEEFEREFFHL